MTFEFQGMFTAQGVLGSAMYAAVFLEEPACGSAISRTGAYVPSTARVFSVFANYECHILVCVSVFWQGLLPAQCCPVIGDGTG